jgi:hypothetical protein
MSLNSGATIFDYCERGGDPSFWAEPLNAVTNAAFLLAALAGIATIVRRPIPRPSLWSLFFILNVAAIGIGSFLFHTIPNSHTVQADTGPIGVFMLTYLVFAMRRFAGASSFLTAAAVAGFVGSMVAAFNIRCWDGRIGFLLDAVPPGASARCLNGSLGYAPALIVLAAMAAWLQVRRHPAAQLLRAAALTFVVSVTFRSLDQYLCGDLVFFGYRLGTHFIWHLLNASTLYFLLAAAIEYGNEGRAMASPRPS